MTDEQIEIEARGVFALMDGMQLQWLLDPSLPVVKMFQTQLDMILERWTRGAKVRRRRAPRPRLSASGVTADPALTAGGRPETGPRSGTREQEPPQVAHERALGRERGVRGGVG